MLRRPLRLALVLLVLGAVAVPVVAYVVVPQFVRKTLVEPPPAAAAASTPASLAPTAGAAASPGIPAVRLAGMLQRVDAVHYGSGSVTISGNAGDRVLRFEGVAIAGAPDMYVYLSDHSDGQPGRFVNLGKLKATDGSFNYPIPGDVDLSPVRSVVVWCRAFSVTVTWAPLA